MFYKLPEKAREEIVFDFAVHPMTLNVVALEVRNNTELGKKILRALGFEDDEVKLQ